MGAPARRLNGHNPIDTASGSKGTTMTKRNLPKLPDGITVNDRGAELEVQWRWFHQSDLPGMIAWVVLFVVLLIIFPSAAILIAIAALIVDLCGPEPARCVPRSCRQCV